MSQPTLRIGTSRRAFARRPLGVLLIVGFVLAIALIVFGLVGDFIVDWLWFSELGYFGVFWTSFLAQTQVFGVVFAVSAAILWLNGAIALRRATKPAGAPPQQFNFATAADLAEFLSHWRLLPRAIAAVALTLALAIAWLASDHWALLLRFLYAAPAGTSEPLYGHDIGFYLFTLPAYIAIKDWLILTLFLAAALAGLVYWIRRDLIFDPPQRKLAPHALAHFSGLLGCFFLVKAFSYALDRYLLLYGDNGVVVGASFTDIHVRLPVLWMLTGVAVAGAAAAFANLRAPRPRLPVAAFALIYGTSIIAGGLFPALTQRIYVRPNELALERPYIARNIALTQLAYNLHQISAAAFPASDDLSASALAANQATIDNIRLWDWQPLMDTYRQMQEIRTYYKFHDVDIDRYWLDGKYQQVMLSARELKSALLPPNAQTWVNRHVLFTHGSGVVMSPVRLKSDAGLPLFYLRDIPPVATGGPHLSEPRIYYGEETDDYVIVKGTTQEFDYPHGKDNVYASYDGAGGIGIGGIAARALFAWYVADLNLLLTRYIGPESRIMIRRNIRERVHAIAPFLQLDPDPYLVIHDGRLFFVQDAYTTSDYFPYAQPVGRLNYIRNSVKIIIDAYNGSVDFYLIDPADPVAATYARIFPKLFKPLAAMPDGLQRHLRYPDGLFRIQAEVYRAYHMTSPEVFYNREDLWQFPRHTEGGPQATMAPYYMVMRLPGATSAEFVLMLPMAPSQRQNMIAWLAARCDPPNYGKLIAYEFPKDKLVYGPFQIEALINQNTEISQQLSLWNQSGSRVTRGNILVIPIENSILYVSPLYLRAEQGHLPELKRVIAAYGERVVMRETLGEALAALFVETAAPAGPKEGAAETNDDRLREALRHYNEALERLKAGDWTGFGAALEALRAVLEGK
jgi:uncharacterized membrane protein (UPF0182 family)